MGLFTKKNKAGSDVHIKHEQSAVILNSDGGVDQVLISKVGRNGTMASGAETIIALMAFIMSNEELLNGLLDKMVKENSEEKVLH